MITDLKRETMRKVRRRIVPLLMAALLFTYLDKVILGFAALSMNQDLGFSNTVFAAGAGFFALGYALFAIPSTLLMHKFGARRWITVIMIAWGLCSAATVFVKTPAELLTVRFLLGMAEAGFAPGAILYFSYWFPTEYRGRVLGLFLLIYPLGMLIGGPASSLILSWNGTLGLASWQWLFLIEALPTIALAVIVFKMLTDTPDTASWLLPAEKHWLVGRLASEPQNVPATTSQGSSWSAFKEQKLWELAAANLTLSTAGIGALILLPLIMKSMGYTIFGTGWVAALPGVAAGLTLPLWGTWADRTQSRELVVALACGMIAVGLAGAGALMPSSWALVALCIAMVGFHGCLAVFWTLPSAFLMGAGAASGIAFINIVGNLGTFTGPYLLGWLSDKTQSHVVGLVCLAAFAAVAAGIMVSQIKIRHADAAIS